MEQNRVSPLLAYVVQSQVAQRMGAREHVRQNNVKALQCTSPALLKSLAFAVHRKNLATERFLDARQGADNGFLKEVWFLPGQGGVSGVLYRVEPLMMRNCRGAGHREDMASDLLASSVAGRSCRRRRLSTCRLHALLQGGAAAFEVSMRDASVQRCWQAMPPARPQRTPLAWCTEGRLSGFAAHRRCALPAGQR